MKGRIPRKLAFAWTANPPRQKRALLGYRTALWKDAKQIFGCDISVTSQVGILLSTSKYVTEMEVRNALLNPADVAKVGRLLCGSIVRFRRAFEGAAGGEL